MTRLLSPAALRSAVLVAIAASTAAAQSLLGSYGECILAAGEPAPGIPGVNIFSTSSSAFDTPVMDQDGYWVCRARLEGAVTSLDDRAIFAGFGAGNLQPVVRAGDQAPGLAPGIFLRSNTSGASGPSSAVQVSPRNRFVYFSSSLSDGSVTVTALNDSALFWGQAGSLQVMAREGDPVPFLPNGELWGPVSSFSRQNNTINSNGRTVFTTTVTGGLATAADDLVMVTGIPGALEIVVREGQDLDGVGGTAVGTTSTSLSFSSQINEGGQILIDGKIGGTATTANDSYLGAWTPGVGLQFIVREGDQAPGLPVGIVMTGSFGRGSNSWNNSAKTGFTAVLNDGGATVTTANDNCLFYGGVGTATMIAREGDPTGLPGGELFGVFNNSSINSNDNDVICFNGSLTDSLGAALPTNNDTAIFYGTPGNFTMLVREGEVVSAIPASVNGPWVAGGVSGLGLYLNGNDQMMVSVSCNDSVVTQSFMLAYDPDLGMQVVQNAAESYTTSLGPVTASGVLSQGGSQSNGGSCPNWFNNAGDFVARQSFTGSSAAGLVRGHVGLLQGTPSSLSLATGGTHSFGVHAGVQNAFDFYAIIGSISGTGPTVVPQLGPLAIPLTFDVYTSLSIDLFNSAVYPFSLWFTDANGDGNPGSAFVLPAGTNLPAGVLYHAMVGLDLGLMETFVSEPRAVELY